MEAEERPLDNAAPRVHGKAEARIARHEDLDEDVVDEIDRREVFDLLRSINDPEHPLTLEELNVVRLGSPISSPLPSRPLCNCAR